jgi:hypothetical protein
MLTAIFSASKPKISVGAKHSGDYFWAKTENLLPECFALALKFIAVLIPI